MKDAQGHGSNARGGAAHQQGVAGLPASSLQLFSLNSLRPTQATETYTDPYDVNVINGFRRAIRTGRSIPPIIAASNGDIIDGHHRWLAYKAEGVKQVPVDVQSNPQAYRNAWADRTMREIAEADAK